MDGVFGYYKTVYPVAGENNEIVPKGSIGYLLDKSCTSQPQLVMLIEIPKLATVKLMT